MSRHWQGAAIYWAVLMCIVILCIEFMMFVRRHI